MGLDYNIINRIELYLKEHYNSEGAYPEMLYLRPDELYAYFDLSREQNRSRVHYFRAGLPHQILLVSSEVL